MSFHPLSSPVFQWRSPPRPRALPSGIILALLTAASSSCGSNYTTGTGGGVDQIVVTARSSSIPVGSVDTLTASGTDQGAAVTGVLYSWSSSAPAIATVDQGGLVTGVAPGTVTISASAGGKSGSIGITVTTPTPSVTSTSPAIAHVLDTAITLTVRGAGFLPTSVIQWNGQARTTSFLSSTELTTHLATADLAPAGNVNVVVFTPNGGSSGALTFQLLAR